MMFAGCGHMHRDARAVLMRIMRGHGIGQFPAHDGLS